MKKTFHLIQYLFIGAALMLFASCKGCRQQQHQNENVVVFAPGITIPDYQNKTLQTYTLSDKNAVDEPTAIASVKQLVTLMGEQNHFDLTNSIKDGDRLFFVNKLDPSASAVVNIKSGDITANAGSKNYMGYAATPGLLKEREAVQIAQRYLQQLQYADVNDAALLQGHIGGVNMSAHDSIHQNGVYEKFTTVRFDRRLDSVPLLGHSRMVVQLAEEGRLHGIIRQWPSYNGSAVSREAEVVPDDVKNSIAKHLTNENKNAKHIIVNEVNLVYYESRGKIEPALHIICKVQLAKSKSDTTLLTFPYDIVEPILKNPKMVYTYMAEDRMSGAKRQDAINTQEPPKRGDDEKK